MARTVGEQFYHVAMGPLAMAGSSLRRGDVKQGLEELSGESLVGSVQRAIDTVATTVGLPPYEVERLLPTADMDAMLELVASTQLEALEQWQLHMAHAGGLLEAIAKLTADGRAPEAGLSLMRIATKMKLEKALAAPLRELAEHIERWQELLEVIRKQLDEGKELAEARRRRQRVQLGIAALTGIALMAVSALGYTVMNARKNVEAVLAQANPCEVELIAPGDLSMAGSSQKASVTSKREACRLVRERAKIAEQKQREEEARLERELEKKRARAALCKELGARLAKPSAEALDPKLSAMLGKDAPFMAELSRGKLADDDVTRDVSAMSCMDGESGDAVASAFAAAAIKTAESWLPGHSPSPSVVALIARGKGAVSKAARENLVPPIEKLALDALVTGKVEFAAKARRKCDVLTALDVTPHLYCKTVLRKPVK